MRGFSPAALAALAAGATTYRLVKFGFSSPLLFTTAPRPITHGGEVFVPSSVMGILPDLSDELGMVPGTIDIPMSGVSLAEHALTTAENYLNREVTQWLYVEGVDEAQIVWEGYIQNAPSKENWKTGKADISWKCASHWANWQQKNGRILSLEGHQATSGDDTDVFFEYIGVTDDRLEDWESVNEGLTGNPLIDGLIDAGADLLNNAGELIGGVLDGLGSIFGGGGGGGGQTMAKQEASHNLIKYPSAFRRLPVLYGTTRTKGIPMFRRIDDAETSSLYVVYALGEGECDSLVDITFKNGEPYTGSNYSGLVDVVGFYNGTATQTADPTLIEKFPTLWTANHKGAGVCYVVLKYAKDEVWSGEPKPAFIVKGKKLFDPRTSVTEWSANCALIVNDLSKNPIYGKNLPDAKINLDLIKSGADRCDEQITDHDGTGVGDNAETPSTINRYEFNGAISTDDSVKSNVEKVLFNMRAFYPRYSGQHHLILQQPNETSVYTIDENNTEGEFSVMPLSATEKNNVIYYEINDPRINYRKANFQIDNAVYLAEDNGIESSQVVGNLFENNRYRALRHGDMILDSGRTGIRVEDKIIQGDAVDLTVGSIVKVSRIQKGWVDKLFRVHKTVLNNNNEVRVFLKGYVSDNHDATLPKEKVPANDSILYNPLTVGTVTDIAFTSGTATLLKMKDGSIVSRVKGVIAVAVDEYVTGYIVEYKKTSETNYTTLTTLYGRTNNEFFISPAEDEQSYTVKITTFNAFGRKTKTPFTKAHVVVGKTEAPGEPSALSALSGVNAVHLDWINPVDLDFSHVEIHAASTNNFTLSAIVGTDKGGEESGVRVGAFTHPTTANKYYWLIARDTTGNGSDIFPGNPIGGILGSPSPVTAGDLSGTVDWSSQIGGSGKPADNANLTTNTNQLTDGAGLGNTAQWSGVGGSGKPQDNANLTTNTNQLTDGANLGNTAQWSGVGGAGKPADNATLGAQVDGNLLDAGGNPIDAVDYFSNTGLYYRIDFLTLDGFLSTNTTIDEDGVLVSAANDSSTRYFVKPISTRVVPINFDKTMGFKTRAIFAGLSATYDGYVGIGNRYDANGGFGAVFDYTGGVCRLGVWKRTSGALYTSAYSITFANGDDLTLICVKDGTVITLTVINNTTELTTTLVYDHVTLLTGSPTYELSVYMPIYSATATLLLNEWFVFQAP